MTAREIRQVDPDAIEVGVKIHTEMFRQRMSQQELAVRLGLTQVSVSRKLRGLTGITVPELMQIGRVLGVDPADLLPREADLVLLPRLDSNQQPSGYQSPEVTAAVLDLFTGERVA